MPEIQKMTGFQSPCAEYAEDVLSLDKKFLTNPPAMFFIRVKSDSTFLNLFKGDLLLVDRSVTPLQGDLVIAVVSDNFVIGVYVKRGGKDFLLPFNKVLGDPESEDDYIWGVIDTQFRRRRKGVGQ
ncbi:MAG TPA: S24 family peptidase [Bacteriovoracaceae bacterium]|nr:S24 family peptidase [Bacteriovoracaceae bacterium]